MGERSASYYQKPSTFHFLTPVVVYMNKIEKFEDLVVW